MLIYSGSEVTVFAFAEVMNALQTANGSANKNTDRVCAVIKALLPEDAKVPSASVLRKMLIRTLPPVRRVR